MSDFEDGRFGSDGPASTQRIGNGERDAAIAALKVHHTEGRLDSQEYEDRAVAVSRARAWADLDPLFADLPEPRPVAGAASSSASSASADIPSASEPGTDLRSGGLLPQPTAAMVMSLTPLAAVLLFFMTGSWLWFLGIPIMGIVVYGPEGRHGQDRRWYR